MPKVPRYAKSILIKPVREEQFQQQLERGFYLMSNSQIFSVPKIRIPGLILFTPFRKPANYEDFTFQYYLRSGLWGKVGHIIRGPKNMLQISQVFEILKNAAAHGGDALIAARVYRRIRRKVIEFVIWDNGPGIQNIRQALVSGYTSGSSELFTDFYGAGKGLDTIIGEEPTRYSADEIIIESGHQRVFRRNQTDVHHFEESQKPTRGTKVTLRFWSKQTNLLSVLNF